MESLPVQWKGTVYKLAVCYSEQQAAELLARWPDGVIDLAKIFEHESPSSPRARAWIVRAVLAAAGEPIAPEPIKMACMPLADRQAADIAAVQAALASRLTVAPEPVVAPE